MHFKVTKGKPGRSDITMDKHRGKGNNVHPDRKKRKVFDPVKDKEARRRREQQDLCELAANGCFDGKTTKLV